MALFRAHGVERAPIGFGRLLRIELKSRDMLRSSGGYDTNDVASHGVGHEEHPALDQANRVETQLAGRVDVAELDHFRGRSEVDFLRFACSLALSHSKSIASPEPEYTDFQYLRQGRLPARCLAGWPIRASGAQSN